MGEGGVHPHPLRGHTNRNDHSKYLNIASRLFFNVNQLIKLSLIYKSCKFYEIWPRANPKTPHPLDDDEEASVLTSHFDPAR